MSTTRPVEIRLGAVKRLTKELLTRRIDVDTEKARRDRFIAEGKDRWDVGKQVRVSFHAKLMGRVERSPR
jgi:hypothetical protein